jgi:hypothetical protein
LPSSRWQVFLEIYLVGGVVGDIDFDLQLHGIFDYTL